MTSKRSATNATKAQLSPGSAEEKQGNGCTPLRPIRDRVLIRLPTPVERTTSGIIIPETAREAPTEGVVVAVGRAVEARPAADRFGAGDRVLFHPLEGHLARVDGEELLVLRAAHVIAVLEA